MKDLEINEGLRRLRGQTPNGRVFDEHGKEIKANPENENIQSNRPTNWRKNQTKSIKDILRGV